MCNHNPCFVRFIKKQNSFSLRGEFKENCEYLPERQTGKTAAIRRAAVRETCASRLHGEGNWGNLSNITALWRIEGLKGRLSTGPHYAESRRYICKQRYIFSVRQEYIHVYVYIYIYVYIYMVHGMIYIYSHNICRKSLLRTIGLMQPTKPNEEAFVAETGKKFYWKTVWQAYKLFQHPEWIIIPFIHPSSTCSSNFICSNEYVHFTGIVEYKFLEVPTNRN